MLKNELPHIFTSTVPGPEAAKILAQRRKEVPDGLGCIYPCVMKDAEGAMIEDPDGNRFLDWIGGVGVLNVGHAHPEVIDAVKNQADLYFHGMFSVVTHPGYVELAEKMNSIVPVRGEKKRTFFVNSGAETLENAVKIARLYTKRPNIITFSGAFHGRTLLTMTMTAKKSYSEGIGPFPDGICRAQFPYLYRGPEGMDEKQALAHYIRQFQRVFEELSPAGQVAAVVIEPVQGEGGFIPVPLEYVKALREICDDNGILIVADEVQSGIGRTGRMFASCYWEEIGLAPDIITFAKSIAAGLPLGGITAREEIMQAIPGGRIGGTFGGNALSCAAALKVLEIVERDDLCKRAGDIGAKCMNRFNAWKEKYEQVGDVRGLGAMIGIEFVKTKTGRVPDADLVNRIIGNCSQHGLLVENAGTFGNVIRFLAPLVITDEQLEAGFLILEDAIYSCSAQQSKCPN